MRGLRGRYSFVSLILVFLFGFLMLQLGEPLKVGCRSGEDCFASRRQRGERFGIDQSLNASPDFIRERLRGR